MGIGRRRFLEYMSTALVGLAIDPLKAVAINSDNYVNKKFCILLTKPENWDFVSIKDFGKLKKTNYYLTILSLTKEKFGKS